MNTEIVEGNKLIAEFMEIQKEQDWYNYLRIYPFVIDGKDKANKHRRLFADEMKYHSSWDWQIPVWGKIGAISQKYACDEDSATRHNKLCDDYEMAVFQNDPMRGQQILVKAISWYNKGKEDEVK